MLSEEKELDSILTEGDILILVNKLHSSVNSYGYSFSLFNCHLGAGRAWPGIWMQYLVLLIGARC